MSIGLIPELAWNLWRREKCLLLIGTASLFLGYPAPGIVSLLTELSRLICFAAFCILLAYVLHATFRLVLDCQSLFCSYFENNRILKKMVVG
jgi:hypothetical protein